MFERTFTMKIKFFTGLVILFVVLVSACSPKNADRKHNQPERIEITISAAASLKDALDDIKADFEKTNKKVTLLFNLGGSGALMQQIIQGAPTDIFISAAKDPFEELTKSGL